MQSSWVFFQFILYLPLTTTAKILIVDQSWAVALWLCFLVSTHHIKGRIISIPSVSWSPETCSFFWQHVLKLKGTTSDFCKSKIDSLCVCMGYVSKADQWSAALLMVSITIGCNPAVHDQYRCDFTVGRRLNKCTRICMLYFSCMMSANAHN